MNKTKVIIVVAYSDNRIIGNKGKLPWSIPEDLKRFKELTIGHPVIMGRKTYESIGRPLVGRTNIVITRNKNINIDGVIVSNSIRDIINTFSDIEKVFIIGGSEIYRYSLSEGLVDEIHATELKKIVKGDAYFPFIPDNFKERSRTNVVKNGKIIFDSVIYQKIK